MKMTNDSFDKLVQERRKNLDLTRSYTDLTMLTWEVMDLKDLPLNTSPSKLKATVGKIESLLRKFKINTGLEIRRSKATLSGESLAKYEAGNKRRYKRYYALHSKEIMEARKMRAAAIKAFIVPAAKND